MKSKRTIPAQVRPVVRHKRRKKSIHLGVNTYTGIYNYCDNTIRGDYSFSMDKVTCKKCLKTEITRDNVDIARLAMGAYQSYTDKPARIEVFVYNDGSSTHNISGQINPCVFGDQCEGHACYCNNEKAGCRKCHFSWYNGEKDLDKQCEFYEPNPLWIDGEGDFYEQRDKTVSELYAKGLVEIEITRIAKTPPEHHKGKKSIFYEENK